MVWWVQPTSLTMEAHEDGAEGPKTERNRRRKLGARNPRSLPVVFWGLGNASHWRRGASGDPNVKGMTVG